MWCSAGIQSKGLVEPLEVSLNIYVHIRMSNILFREVSAQFFHSFQLLSLFIHEQNVREDGICNLGL
jgi:hypothetical protein